MRTRTVGSVRSSFFGLLLGTCATGALVAASCNSGAGGSGTGASGSGGGNSLAGPDWQPSGTAKECNQDAFLSPEAYGRKVKTLLTGLALTDDELAKVSDPAELKTLIGAWLALPEARGVFERVFTSDFQQDGETRATLYGLIGRRPRNVGFFGYETARQSPDADVMLNANFAKSFVMTAADIAFGGEPWSSVVTTRSHYLTTALATYLAFADDEVVLGDGSHKIQNSTGKLKKLVLFKDPANAPPIEQATDPTNANFGHFYHPGLAKLPASCNIGNSITIDPTKTGATDWRLDPAAQPASMPWFYFSTVVLGQSPSVELGTNTNCRTNVVNHSPELSPDDYFDWHRVKIRPPNAGEDATAAYDLKAIRKIISTGGELVVSAEHIGFLTSPGFFSTWMTNEDNSYRVTLNQSLIVALGKTFDAGYQPTKNAPPGVASDHAKDECYNCHVLLDPMREFYRNSFTSAYGRQIDDASQQALATFDFGGVYVQGSGISKFADTLASHPDFHRAWAQKLCYYANGAACPEGPELDRVVAAFQSSDDFKVLVTELFASSLVTGRTCVDGADSGTGAMITRRSTFCSMLSNRLGIDDACSLDPFPAVPLPKQSTAQKDLLVAVQSVPDDAYSRQVPNPVIITDTSLFSRASSEVACDAMARVAYAKTPTDVPGVPAYLVETVMGLPPTDPLHDDAVAVLKDHFTSVKMAGHTDQEAAQSAFVVACMAPPTAGIGF